MKRRPTHTMLADIMNYHDSSPSIPRRRQSFTDDGSTGSPHVGGTELNDCKNDDRDWNAETTEEVLTDWGSEGSVQGSTSSESSQPLKRPRRNLSHRRRSCMSFTKRNWNSLPTIMEYKTSIFEGQEPKEEVRSQSCRSIRGGSKRFLLTPKPQKSERNSLNDVPRKNDNSSFSSASPHFSICKRSSTSRNTTIALLQDLHLSEAKREALATSIQRKRHSNPHSARPKLAGDSILALPRRISSNTVLEAPDHSCSSIQRISPADTEIAPQKALDRFASILSTTLSCRGYATHSLLPPISSRDASSTPPRIPRRPASPINNEDSNKNEK